jgi:predicted dehydrogenase/threonine dehydrogenase-like Zn-dependent dehydrogenase
VKQVVQAASGGPVRVVDVPRPIIGPTEVLVRTVASVVSPGTERALTRLAQASLLQKARARPDLVRQVLRKAKTQGIGDTARAVRARLDEDVPLGYSAAGIALEVGEAVNGVSPGQLVATGGAGRANHAQFQSVPGLLCTPVPEGVPPEDAAFATLASVALHGLRLAEVGPGAKVVVVGLGLVGQLAVRLAQAAGCDVAGLDVAEFPAQRAREAGALGLVDTGDDTTKAVLAWSRGRGADAVLLTAATASSAPVLRSPALCRDGARIVVVGDVGLDLDRRPLYERELTLAFARSYGPGRYDRSYEEWAVDYPAGLVRWTEGRNQEAVLDMLAGGRLDVADLVTHSFDLADAPRAYELVEHRTEPFLAVTFRYPEPPATEGPVAVRRRATPASDRVGIGFVGAGSFAGTVLVPAFKRAGFDRLVAVASASGLSARHLAERAGFERAVSGPEAVIADPDVGVVVVATPHATHSDITVRALAGGRHVFCEKPLALTLEQLDEVEQAWRAGDKVLFVDFNRRWSDAVAQVREHLSAVVDPLVVTYRVNAGALPASHWYHDRRQGGRVLGEVCHFVDTCSAIVGADAVDVQALGSGVGERLLDQDVVVSLRYPGGSLATISYASGGFPGQAKERIDVLGGGHSATVVDFTSLELDGRKSPLTTPGKGHDAAVAAFRRMVLGLEETPDHALASTRTTLLAAAALGTRG